MSPTPSRDAPAGTLNTLFFEAVRKFDKPDAMLRRDGDAWHPVSHREILARVRHAALGIGEIGIRAGDKVAILSENRPEWAIADWACLTVGVTTVPIYPTLPAEQIAALLKDSAVTAICVSTAAQTAKIISIRAELPALKEIIAFDDVAAASHTLGDLEQQGTALDSPARADAWERSALAVRPDDLATVIYTSGTTGTPRGVMLTHGNFFFELHAVAGAIAAGPTDTALSFLPLSHVFQRIADYYLAWRGATIAYADSLDSVPAALTAVRPTICCAVPRFYEKMYAKVLENVAASSPFRRRLFTWARTVGDHWAALRLAGQQPTGSLAFQYALARRLVFSKVTARTGGRLRFFISGGAPLAPDINRFFHAAGLVILEGYGLTETTGVISVNRPESNTIGTVGTLLPGVEAKIAPDGEILTRGPHVMRGYLNQPGPTSEAIDGEGWFHTGDIGTLSDGFLRITDRKKDLIVTAGGKKIAPQPIENLARTNHYISQAVMIGDRRKYPVLLVVPNFDQLGQWAKERNIYFTARAQLLAMPAVHRKIEEEVHKTLIGLASFETPKKIAILPDDFTIERGELTPSLKVKRRVVESSYRHVIDALYEPGEPTPTALRR